MKREVGSMTKTELKRSMTEFAGAAFITRQKLAEFVGVKDPHSVDRYLSDLYRINGKYYFIGDVADSMMGDCSR